jgi:hypothetical protein
LYSQSFKVFFHNIQPPFLGLPRGLFPIGFQFRIVLLISSSLLRIACPNHWILCPLIKLITDAIPNSSCSSLLYFLLQVKLTLS